MRKLLSIVALVCLALPAFAAHATGGVLDPSHNMVTKTQAFAQWSAISSTGTSDSFDVSFTSPTFHSIQLTIAGSPGACTAQLEGTLDGTTWAALTPATACTSSVTFYASAEGAQSIRVNVTALSGGSSPTVTASYQGAGSGTSGISFGSSGTLPATCAVGQMYFKTVTDGLGVIGFYECLATNIWAPVNGGIVGGGNAANSAGIIVINGSNYPQTGAGILSALADCAADAQGFFCAGVDARTVGSVTISSTLNPALNNMLLLLGPYTYTLAGSPGINCNTPGLQIYGVSPYATILTTNSGTADILQLNANCNGAVFRNLGFQSSVARTGGAAINFDLGGSGTSFENIRIDKTFNGIVSNTTSGAATGNNVFRNVQMGCGLGPAGSWNAGIILGGVSSGTINRYEFTDSGITGDCAFTTGFVVLDSGVDTADFTNFVAAQSGVDSPCLVIQNTNTSNAPRWVRFSNSHFEGGPTKTCISVTAATNVDFVNSYIATSLIGMTVNGANASGVNFDNGAIVNIQQNAVLLTSGKDVNISNSRIADTGIATNNTYPSISVAANQNDFTLTNNDFTTILASANVPNYNISVASGTSDNYTIYGNYLVNFGTAGLLDSGTGVGKSVLGNAPAIGQTLNGALTENGLSTVNGSVSIAGLAAPTASSVVQKDATTGHLLHNQAYFYKIACTNATSGVGAGKGTLPSNEVTFTTGASPTADTYSATLAWLVDAGCTGYDIYRSTTSGNELFLASVSGGATTTYTDNSATTPSGALPVATATSLLQFNADTGISRSSAGVVYVGNGTQGDVTGSVRASSFQTSAASPSTVGVLRCASGDSCLGFRNNANGANIALTKSGAVSGSIPADSLDTTAFGALKSGNFLGNTHTDANGNPFILSSATASAVDGITITNAATANPATVTIAGSGTDTNINTALNAKGSGTVQASTYFNSDTNNVILTADWTCGTGGTVSSCVAATIIGSGGGVAWTFTLPTQARSWSLDCDGVVGQATGATLNQWNLLTATNGATNVTASYTMLTAATATTGGATTDQASTTSTFQVAPSWTLGGTATKMPFHIHARIEGASASGTILSVQLVAPTVGDLVTIYRGSGCRLN